MEWDPLFLAKFPHLGDSIFEQLTSETILTCYESGSLAWKAYFDQRKLNILTGILIREKTGCSIGYIKKILLLGTSLDTLLFQLEDVFNNTKIKNGHRQNFMFDLRFDFVDPWKDSRWVRLFLCLNRAVQLGYISVYQLMVENMDNKNPSGEGIHWHRQGETPLHTAAKNGHVELCRIIMNHLDDKNPFGMSKNGETPLHLAARFGHYDVCELILKQVDNKSPLSIYGGLTPRQEANSKGHQNICLLFDNFVKR